MRKLITLTITLAALTAFGAIIFYTDKPNAVPVGNDFMSFQRNRDYINASVNQFSNMLYTTPFFTGNGQIVGNWVVGGTLYGNGAGLSNVATAVYLLSTNGVGQNPTFYGGGNFFGVYHFDEVDALNFFPTNILLNITNKVLLTDGNGQITNAANAHGVFTNTATGLPSFGLLQNTELVNSSITVQGSAVALGGSTLAAGSSPIFNGANITNSTYTYETNLITGTTLTFGQAYRTNLAGNLTLTALTINNHAFYETLILWTTNSSGSDHTVTWPAGVIGPVGTGTPSVMTSTNKTLTRYIAEHYGDSDITVSKTDFGN